LVVRNNLFKFLDPFPDRYRLTPSIFCSVHPVKARPLARKEKEGSKVTSFHMSHHLVDSTHPVFEMEAVESLPHL